MPPGRSLFDPVRRIVEICNDRKEEYYDKLADAATSLLGIREELERMNETKNEWYRFSDYAPRVLAVILAALPRDSSTMNTVKQSVDDLKELEEQVKQKFNSYKGRANIKRLLESDENTKEIESVRQQFEDKLEIFKLDINLYHMSAVDKYLKLVDLQQLAAQVADINQGISHIAPSLSAAAMLERLPYPQGASWNSANTCMPGTRASIIDQASTWMTVDPKRSAEILLIVGVAGSGKSAIAHSISEMAYHNGWLVTSYFFNRLVDERNKPDKFVTTLARDLATYDKRTVPSMVATLESDASLRSTSDLMRQFTALILRSARQCGADNPAVIVIDAFDEGYDRRLLRICSECVKDLPANFRIVITSRHVPGVTDKLERLPHVTKLRISLIDGENRNDVQLYLTARLEEVAADTDRELPWPEADLAHQLIDKAGGLFQWAFTVTEFLYHSTNPDHQLKRILSLVGSQTIEAKMDVLYKQILKACPWEEDEDFVEGYRLFMGTVVAAKELLTGTAIQELHRSTTRPRDIFRLLGSLLTGFESDNEPIGIIHLSLQDFITRRAPPPYHLDEKASNRMLAVLCIQLASHTSTRTMPALENFHLKDESHDEIPKIGADMMTMASHYACRMWPVHLLDVECMSSETMECLRPLLAAHLVWWIKLCVCMGQYQSVGKIRDGLRRLVPEADSLLPGLCDPQLASLLKRVGWRLRRSGRREEALLAAEDSMSIIRHIINTESALEQTEKVKAGPGSEIDRDGQRIHVSTSGQRDPVTAPYHRQLATCLVLYAACLTDMGRRREAVSADQEAVHLYRALVQDQGASFIPDLAQSLSNLSCSLTGVGRRRQSLETVEEAVQLYRVLVHDQAAAFIPDLASSLSMLSICLTDVGRRQEALETDEEAVQLYRTLVQDQAAAFIPDLARSLGNLSSSLIDVGRRQDALEPVEEAVQLYRTLVQDQAAAFIPDLARWLGNLSSSLTHVGRIQDALEPVEESVQLYRVLVLDQAAAFTPNLAASLSIFSESLSDVGRGEESLKAIEEAVRLYRALVQDQAAELTPCLAGSLDVLSNRLADLDRREEALKSGEESVVLYRQLVRDEAVAFKPQLAKSLNTLASRLGDVGRAREALERVTEATQLYQVLVQDEAAAFTPDLAESLYNQSVRSSDAGRLEDAFTYAQEAHTLYRPLAAELPAKFNPWLKKSLKRLSELHAALGQRDESERTEREAEEVSV